MASPNSTFTELVSTTFRNHARQISDNLSKRNALLAFIKKRGNYVKEDGGTSISMPLDYAANSTYQRFSGWDTLNIAQSEVISAADYAWRNIAMHVSASGQELRTNSGKSKLIDLVTARVNNARRTFSNNFSNDLYSDGTLTNQINGLQALVADVNTNTVGGINAGTWDFWQNTVFDLSDNSVTLSATTIEGSAMLPLWLQLDRGMDDQPDLIVMDANHYSFYESSQVSLKRYASSDSANGGIVTIKYKNADVIHDTNSGIPANHTYMINTEYMKLVVHKDADFKQLDSLTPVNHDGVIIPFIWMGQLVCTNRKQQGVIIA